MSASVRWALFAAVGLLVAVAVAVLATQLVSQKIGITSEPVSAGESLSPRADRDEGANRKRSGGAGTLTRTVTTPYPATGPSPTPAGPGAPSPASGSHGGAPERGDGGSGGHTDD